MRKNYYIIMKKFRKPYASLILAFLVLIVSCGEPFVNTNEKINSEQLTETIKEHLLITDEISKIFLEEKDIDFEKLNDFPAYFSSRKELSESFKSANFKNEEKISILFKKLSDNLENFLLSIEDIESYNKKDLENLLSNEIKKQFALKAKNNSKYLSKAGYCENALNEASGNCGENYAISLAVLVASGFISFGWGTIIGYAAANAIMIKCHDDASAAYRTCQAN